MKTPCPNMSIEVKVTITDRLRKLTYVPEHTVVLNGNIFQSKVDGVISNSDLSTEVDRLLDEHIEKNPMHYARINNKPYFRTVDIVGLYNLH